MPNESLSPMGFGLAGEDHTGTDAVRILTDRLLSERVDWIEPETLDAFRSWLDHDHQPGFLDLHRAFELARTRLNRAIYGHFGGRAGTHDARMMRAVLMLFATANVRPCVVFVARDLDGWGKWVGGWGRYRKIERLVSGENECDERGRCSVMPNENRVKTRPETPATSETTSTDRLSEGPWGKTWLVAIVVVAIGLFAYETAMRHVGHVPTLTDDRALWAMQRERIDTSSNSGGGDEESARPAIVLLGASRMQVGIDPEILENLSGRRVVNLAINGHDPMATLQDLAENARQFQGLAIVDIVPSAMRREQWNAQQPWVKFYWQQWGPNERLNREIRTAVQANFAFANPSSALQRVLPALAQGQPPRRFHIHTRHDRFQAADFSIATHLNDRRVRFERALDAVDPNAWRAAHSAMMADFREVARLTRALESRGANVVFVHFASSGPLRELEECQFPRAECWDRFVEIITTSTRAEAFHADDVPALAAIDTPDWSHVDCRDVPAHTRALYDELVRRRVLPSAERSAAAERVGSGASSAISGTERQR